MSKLSDVIQLTDLDRRIWAEELDEFVPRRVYDLHTHLTKGEFDLGTTQRYDAAGGIWKTVYAGTYMETLDEADALLMPGREVSRLSFPMPHPQCDFEGSNRHVAHEAAKDPASGALMLVHPSMTAEAVDSAIRRDRFLGFKPYRWYSTTGDPRNCRIPEFMPEHILEVGNQYGLFVGLHISKIDAIADPENLDDLERLSTKYPRLRWGLFHCARSYSDWPLKQAAPRLRDIPNVWYEGSSVCETDAFGALFSIADPSRVCYGSDDLPVGVMRGKYIAFGRAWVCMHEGNQAFNTDHCDGRMTFTRYEMLRGMKHAAEHAGFTRAQIDDLFFGNAMRLIEAIRRDLAQRLA